jgi:phospholipid transport system transporter-binding protein
MSALKLPDTLLHDQADACLAQWVAHLRVNPQSAVTVDASALVEFDSSALAVLLGFRRVVLAQGGTLHIADMTSRLRELASLYGVLDLLQPV